MTAAPTNKAEAAALLENLALLDFSDHVEQLRYITLSYVSCGKGVMRRVATLTGGYLPGAGSRKDSGHLQVPSYQQLFDDARYPALGRRRV